MITLPRTVSIAVACAMLAAGCATPKRTSSKGTRGHTGAETAQESGSDSKLPTSAPNEPRRPRSLVLVANLRGAHGAATAGALSALDRKKLKPTQIYACGSAALFAALYATSRSSALFEWNLQKVKLESIYGNRTLLGRWFPIGGSPEDRLRSYLEKLFGAKTTANLFGTTVSFRSAGKWESEGRLADLVFLAMTDAEPAGADLELGGVDAEAHVIYLTTSDAGGASGGMRIEPNLTGVDLEAYEKKSDAIFAGSEAIERHSAELDAFRSQVEPL